MITASKPKRKKCPACRKLVNRKNFSRHLRAHGRKKLVRVAFKARTEGLDVGSEELLWGC